MNKFDLRPDPSGGFDFVVDGRFLREMVFDGEDMTRQHVTLLRRGVFSGAIQEQISRLKGELPGQFFPERVWLYFCPECYDEGCGGISANIHVGPEKVVWSDFRYDGEPDTEEESESFAEENAITSVGTLVFDRTEYGAALDRTAELLGRGFVAFWRSTAALDQVTLGLEHLVSRRKQRKSPLDPKEGLQWTIDGRPLSRILQDAGEKLSSEVRDLQSDLHFSVVQEQHGNYVEQGRKAIRVLLGEETWNESFGRAPLFIGECLDIPCGVITVRVERQEGTVIWSDFRVHGAGPDENGHPYDPGMIFTFDRRQHDDVLQRILDRI